MILGALADYYEQLLEDDKVGRDGWSQVKVSYAITIDEDGQVRGIASMMKGEKRGKKEVLASAQRTVPLQRGRSSQVAPYFMCDNAKYLLGAWCPTGETEADEKNRRQALKYFKASGEYHKKLLGASDCPLAKSVCRFFETWDFETAKEKFLIDWEKVATSYNLVFRSYETMEELLESPEISAIWNDNCQNEENQVMGRCLVTGKVAPIARLHPLLKDVRGAQSSGAALVSFNGAAFESYGKRQGDNAPVSEYAANAYGKALNYLLTDTTHHRIIGDTTVVFWASVPKEDGYAQFMSSFFENMEEPEEKKLLKVMNAVARGENCLYEADELKPETSFYVLGLAPNAARISVRFFYNSTFGEMVSNIKEHYERLAIESPAYEKKDYPSIQDILYETINEKSNTKQAQPVLVGALMRSILANGRYPAALYSHIMLRLHAERVIKRNKAAIIKSYLLQNYPDKKEAIDTMQLNEETDYVPYILGRLFAVLEDIQKSAIGKETIRERYFNAASSTPAVIFPQLLKLANSHMRVLGRNERGLQVVREKQLEELMGKMHSNFPTRLSLEDQGVFMIGYYHQVQKRYEKKDNKKEQEV